MNRLLRGRAPLHFLGIEISKIGSFCVCRNIKDWLFPGIEILGIGSDSSSMVLVRNCIFLGRSWGYSRGLLLLGGLSSGCG